MIDASGVVLGKLAVTAANIIRGKNKPNFTPNIDCGDHLIIINTDKVIVTGNKATKTIERFVDQDTDIPVIMPGASGTTLKYNSKAALDAGMEAGWNDNVFVSGGQMTVKVVDDEKIDLADTVLNNFFMIDDILQFY